MVDARTSIMKIHKSKMTKLSELIPSDYNPREIGEDAKHRLNTSLKSYGLVENLVANKRTGTLVGGHQRLDQLFSLFDGDVDSKIPVVWVDLNKDEEQALNIALNGEYGVFNDDRLRSILNDIQSKNGGDLIDRIGLSRSKISEILDSIKPPADITAKPDPVDALENVKKVFKHGKVVTAASHVIGCLDVTDSDAVLAAIGGAGMAQVVWTDPPFLADYSQSKTVASRGQWSGEGEGGRTRKSEVGEIKNDAISPGDWDVLVSGILSTAKMALSSDGVMYFCIGQRSLMAAEDILAREGWHISSRIVWDKKWIRPGRQDYRPQYEVVIYAWPQKNTHRAGNFRHESDVWPIATDAGTKYLHPTQKPIALPAKALRNSTRRGELILDLCCGVGASALAAESLGRRSASFDLEPRYCDVVLARLNEEAGSK